MWRAWVGEWRDERPVSEGSSGSGELVWEAWFETRACLCLSGRGRKWEAGLGQQVVQKMPLLLPPAHLASFPYRSGSCILLSTIPRDIENVRIEWESQVWKQLPKSEQNKGCKRNTNGEQVEWFQLEWLWNMMAPKMGFAMWSDLSINSGKTALGSNPSSTT